MKPVALNDFIYWVGGIDWDLRNFHGYMTQRGSTYNAYLIMDQKITLIDTVKYYLYDEMIERISKVVDPSKIDIIISNHVEMDHSGGLPKLMELYPNATLITSPNGAKGLEAHYKNNWNYKVMKTGDSISLGKTTLQFILEQMVHWPDNMACYMPETKILFSNDAFGQHIATSERFDTEYPLDIIMYEAKKYYANIVLPYDKQTQKVLDAVSTLDIAMIAPSHGIIWKDHVRAIVTEYKNWAANKTKEKALIIYDTMWNSTKMIAHAIKNAFEEKNIPVQLYDLKTIHISDIMTEVLDAKYICVGSPTLNNNMLPTVAAFLTYCKGLAPKNRVGLAFGSYGWGGQSVAQVEAVLQEMGWQLLPSIKVNYVPDDQLLGTIAKQVFEKL
ncbi:MAG: FprA family A-type flavoprotein [Spirochaetota bacterium]